MPDITGRLTPSSQPFAVASMIIPLRETKPTVEDHPATVCRVWRQTRGLALQPGFLTTLPHRS